MAHQYRNRNCHRNNCSASRFHMGGGCNLTHSLCCCKATAELHRDKLGQNNCSTFSTRIHAEEIPGIDNRLRELPIDRCIDTNVLVGDNRKMKTVRNKIVESQ